MTLSAVAPRGTIDLVRFTGSWLVKRRVVDHQNSVVHGFAGTVVLTERSFREAGTLRLDDRHLNAERAYGLAFSEDGVEVSYPDGSGFIRLRSAGPQLVRHLCGADVYLGFFGARSADCWLELWRVRGPKKRYSSLSRYERAPA